MRNIKVMIMSGKYMFEHYNINKENIHMIVDDISDINFTN